MGLERIGEDRQEIKQVIFLTRKEKTMVKKEKVEKQTRVEITPPNFQIAEFTIKGTSPYVQSKWSKKAKEEMKSKQEAGSTAKKGTKRAAKDFDECYKQAQYIAKEGWHGIPAPNFRNAMISACKMVGFQMTRAKLSIFVLSDGYDTDENAPLVKITKGKPFKFEAMVRNATGVADIRIRPMWDEGWEANLRIRYDADQFTLEDVANLLMRAGVQVGVGEGRPGSSKSNGLGWGMFEIAKRK